MTGNRIGDEFAPDRSAFRLHAVKRKKRFRFAAADFEIRVPLPAFLDELRGGDRLGKGGLQRARKRTHGLARLPNCPFTDCARVTVTSTLMTVLFSQYNIK